MSRVVLSETLTTYVLAQIPGWMVAILLAWGLERWYDVPSWVGVLLVSLWIGTDLVLFPRMRRFYEPVSSESRIIGDVGVCATDLTPHGFVRVYGELWQAETVSKKTIPEGLRVCVRDIRGLLLIVEPLPARCGAGVHDVVDLDEPRAAQNDSRS